MDQRYKTIYRFPSRLYTEGSPVVLEEGALLADRKVPRIVAQLKFKSISTRRVIGIRGVLLCKSEQGTVEAGFAYADIPEKRGVSFGQYRAIVLPRTDIFEISLVKLTAVFSDGSAWVSPQNAQWESLPAFVSLEEALSGHPRLLSLSRRLAGGRYLYQSRQGIWYCPCGGVNMLSEERCHRCGMSRARAMEYASEEGLAGFLDASERERRSEEEERAARKREAFEERQELKADIARKARIFKERVAGKSAAIPLGGIKKRGRFALALGTVCLVAAAAAFIFMSWGNGKEVATGLKPAPQADVTTPYDGGTVSVEMKEDSNGIVKVSLETVAQAFPEAEGINFGSLPDMGNEIDPYLKDCFHMASLVSSGGAQGSGGEWGSFSSKNVSRHLWYLFVFDGNMHLAGYSVSTPKDMGNGVWSMELTKCDYDFTALYEEQAGLFSESGMSLFENYIPPEELEKEGVKRYISGYNTGRLPIVSETDPQIYHLWSRAVSPYAENMSHDIDDIGESLPDEGRIRCFLLFDRDMELLGYTFLDHEGNSCQSEGPEIKAEGSVTVTLSEDPSGRCVFTEEGIKEYIPQAEIFNLHGGLPDLGDDTEAYIRDSLHVSWMAASAGRSRGGHSSAMFNFKNEGIFALTFYSDMTTLCGYFVGRPRELGQGKWQLEITLCDYDLTDMITCQAENMEVLSGIPEISQYDIPSAGASFFLEPVSQVQGGAYAESAMKASMAGRLTSEYLAEYASEIESFPLAAKGASEGNERCFLLLDGSFAPLGVTYVSDGEGVCSLMP